MSRAEDYLEAAELHGLLAEAAAGAGEPLRGVEEAFADAARVRKRRRLAVSGAAAVVAAGLLAFGMTAGPGASNAGPAATSATPTPVRTLPTPSRVKPDPGVTVQQLVPPGTGEVKLVDNLLSIDPDGGVLDGTYLVHKDGAVGLIQVMGSLAIPDNPGCKKGEVEAGSLSCTYEDLGNGWGVRLEELAPQQHPGLDGRRLGRTYDAILGFGTGKIVHVTVGGLVAGPGADGPAMAAPPLTLDQLRTFVLRPELLSGGDWGRQSPPPGVPRH